MGLYNKLPDEINEVDVIIAGGTLITNLCGSNVIN